PTIELLQRATSSGSTGSVPEPNWANDVWFTIAIGGIRLFAALAAAGFGITVAYLGTVGRNLFRTVFLIPALLLGPLSFGFSGVLLAGVFNVLQSGHQIFTLVGEALLSFTMLVLIALWLFPATRSGVNAQNPQARTRIVLLIFLQLAAFASGLQAFALPSTINFLAGMVGPQSFSVHINTLTVSAFDEYGSARIGAILLFLVGVLGVAAGILLVATNFRLDFHRFGAVKTSVGSWLAIVFGVFVFAILLVIVAIFFTGFFSYASKFAQGFSADIGGATGFGPLISAVGNLAIPVLGWLIISLFVTYLAAFGIGALRPFGRYSEWLLLPFFPYLFLSVVTLLPIFLHRISQLHLFSNPVALLYPLLVPVLQLVFLTFFFKGQVYRRSGETPRPSFGLAVLLPSIPVALTFGIASALIAMRDSCWYLSTFTNAKTPVTLFYEGWETNSVYSLCYYPLAVSIAALVFLFPVFALLQIFVVDRLRIRVGRDLRV
ncbi:MAG: hypothetical protein JO331_11825, partial [Verrucomicrobia bacterium]|nr:hypothetical protein [Verrucomicrobiota bacterium]